MDIYLLRDGKEIGPFSEETTQSFLKKGTIVIDDLAWTPGLPSWSPLMHVLYPQQAAVELPVEEPIEVEQHIVELPVAEVEPPIEEPAPPAPVREEPIHGEPATAKQKAFLSYLGIPFSSTTTKETAAVLVNEAMEDPKLNARIVQWNGDRLRLHPDIFAAELQAKRENRSNRFFEACQHEGADILVDVTRAHCQVLVGFLDVTYPNWDANDADAPRTYFFPAVAEKFPQLVRKEWRDKLHFPNGQKAAAAAPRRNPSTPLNPAPSPMGALIRGAVFGLALLLALYVGVQIFSDDPEPESPTPAEVPAAPLLPAQPVKVAAAPEPAKAPAPEADEPKQEAPAPSTPPPAAETPAMETTPITPAAPKTHVIITKPVDVKLRFGSAKVAKGTQFKIISVDAVNVTVIYGAETVTIPVEYTDLSAPPAPAPEL